MISNPGKQRQHRTASRVSRAVVWRRSQIRRGLAAVLAAVAVWLGISAASADPQGPTTTVVVADVEAGSGHELSSGDLSVISVPLALSPLGASGATSDWEGKRLAAPVNVGDVLTPADISVVALADGQPPGYVVTHLPLASEALVRAAPAGTRVDVLSTTDGAVLAADVIVLAGTVESDAGGEGPGLFVAMSAAEAGAIAVQAGGGAASALAGSGVTVVLRPEPGSATPEPP